MLTAFHSTVSKFLQLEKQLDGISLTFRPTFNFTKFVILLHMYLGMHSTTSPNSNSRTEEGKAVE